MSTANGHSTTNGNGGMNTDAAKRLQAALAEKRAATPAAPPRKKVTLADALDTPTDGGELVLLYGVEGVGKSTFATPEYLNPFILQAERVGKWVKGKRSPLLQSFDEAMDWLDVLRNEKHDHRILGVDSIDHLEPLVWGKVLQGTKWKNIEQYDGGYMKGYEAALDVWRVFMRRIEDLREDRGMHVVLVGHALAKTFKNPLGNDYERYTPKLHHKAASFLKERVDHVLFAKYESFAQKNEGGRVKGVTALDANGAPVRLLHTQWSAAYDAKNRASLPAELPLSWEDFHEAVKAAAPKSFESLLRELEEVLQLVPSSKRQLVADTAAKAETADKLAKILDRARALAMSDEAQEENATPNTNSSED